MGSCRSCWKGTTSALLPEEITSKGDLSFICVLSIKVPIRKKSGNLFNDPRKFNNHFFSDSKMNLSIVNYRIILFNHSK